MTSEKAAVRARMRATRAMFAGAPLPAPDAFVDRLAPGSIVATYVPLGGEADPGTLVAAARASGCRIALPHVVDRATPLRFLDWSPEAVLHDGPYGLRQPHGTAPVLRPDIILTPLVAFDRSGQRIGQGAGHYDRAFVAYPHAWRIGIAWSVHEVARLTPDPWDVPLHAVLTEKEWIEP